MLMLLTKARPIGERLARLEERRTGPTPQPGDCVEFDSDRHVEEGPCTGSIVRIDGPEVTIKGSGSEMKVDWPSLGATSSRAGNWFVKAEPTSAQIAAGNYKKRVVRWRGLDLAIENEAGSVRRGLKPDGSEWATHMTFAYGYVKRSEGVDGDEVDVFLGPDLDAPDVYVVHQRKVDDWSAYDEDKCMIGFDSEMEARDAFLASYDDPRFLGPVTAMPAADFVEKVRASYDRPAMIKGQNPLALLRTCVGAVRAAIAPGS